VTFPGIAIELGLAECGEYHADVFGVLLNVIGPYDDIVKVDMTEFT
jgi:hypothetical protein